MTASNVTLSMLYHHTMTSCHIINQSIIIYNSNSPVYKRGIESERLLFIIYVYTISLVIMHNKTMNLLCNITSCNPDIICYTKIIERQNNKTKGEKKKL